jgi:hypothetical protein
MATPLQEQKGGKKKRCEKSDHKQPKVMRATLMQAQDKCRYTARSKICMMT